MKVLRIVALVVGAVALIATGVGAVMGAAAFAATFGVSLATVSAIGMVAGIVGQLAAKKPRMPGQTAAGSQTDFKIDPNAPLPVALGRSCSGGFVVHRDTWGEDPGTEGPDNKYQLFMTVYSIGPIDAFDSSVVIDRVVTPFYPAPDYRRAEGYWDGYVWKIDQLGAQPEPAALVLYPGGYTGWGAADKLSGLAASGITIKFDPKGKKFTGGVPRFQRVHRGVRCYDPRLDGTYPGGAGPQRADNEATWAYSENPWIQAISWILGWRQNGVVVAGIGSPVTGIDLPSFVEAANVADANGWKCGGVVTTDDSPWNVLKSICQAGGGEPIWLGARIAASVSAPRVSVATIRSADLKGVVSVVGTQSRRGGRINAIIPTYRSEPHKWEMVPADEVAVSTYLAEDGGKRTRGETYGLVQDLGQVGELAAYDLVNGREFGPIKLPLGPEWIGLRPGMAVDLEIPEMALDGQQAVVLSRLPDFQRGVIEFELRSETPEKHAFALGATTTAPPTPSIGDPEDDEAEQDQFESDAARIAAILGSSLVGAEVTVVGGDVDVTAHQRIYPDRTVNVAASEKNGLALGEIFWLFYEDALRVGGAVVLQSTQVYVDAFASPAHPYRHFVGEVHTAAVAGDSGSGTGPTYPGGGGRSTWEAIA